MANEAPNRFEGETSLYPLANIPMHTLHIDHFGPLPETVNKRKYILVIVDAFTRFTWLHAVKSTTSSETIKSLTATFCTFGNPTNVVTDRGTAYTSAEFANFTEIRQIKHRLVATASPWANGIVERANRFIKNTLIKSVDDPKEWEASVERLQYVINNTYHSVVKASPSKLMLGYEQRNHADFPLAQYTAQLTAVDFDLEAQRAHARDAANAATDLIRNYNKEYRNQRAKKPTMYKEGELVLIRNTRNKPGESGKLKPSYKGPYLIKKSLGNNRYVVCDVPGFNLTSRPLDTILSADKIKRWIKDTPPPEK